MITASKDWLRRNRSNFAIGIGVIGGTYVAGQYVLSKIFEAKERLAGDRIAKENLRRRFQQNQEDCTITVLELLPTVAQNVLEALPSECILNELRQKRSEKLGKSASPSNLSSGSPSAANDDSTSRSTFQSSSFVHTSQMAASSTPSSEEKSSKTKAQLWDELKISSITRSLTLIYVSSLLTLLTRIQLNLLGRKSYMSSLLLHASSSPRDATIFLENCDDRQAEGSYGNDFELNRRYLTFSWWLMHRGWKTIMIDVEVAVRQVFGSLRPTEEIPLETMSSLILEMRKRIEGSTAEERNVRKWLPSLLPSREEEETVFRESGMTTWLASASELSREQKRGSATSLSKPQGPESSTPSPALRRLLDETSDVIDSPMFTHVLTLILDAAFSHLMDQRIRVEAYGLPLQSSRLEDIPDDEQIVSSAKLATTMAVMSREAHKIGSGVPNVYVQAIESVRELEAFAAVIYSSNFEIEAGFKPMAGFDFQTSGSPHVLSGQAKSLEIMSNDEGEAIEKGAKVAGLTDWVGSAWAGIGNVWDRIAGHRSDEKEVMIWESIA